jgi:hypothetical protein
MKAFLMSPLGQATVAICLGLLLVAYPPGVAMLAAGVLLSFGFVRLAVAFRPARPPITLTCRRNDHDAETTGAAFDLVPGRDRDLSARP